MKRVTPPALPVCPVRVRGGDPDALISHEWLVTNGLGGFSSGTVRGVITRRYHGLLVAALPNPLGRVVMLNALEDSLDVASLVDFHLEGGIPVWRYELDGLVVEKRVCMPYRQNTVYVQYRSSGRGQIPLRATPAVHFRSYEESVSERLPTNYSFRSDGDHYRLEAPDFPPLRIIPEGGWRFEPGERRRDQVQYAVEESRGYHARGELWSPGTYAIDLAADRVVAIVASTEELDVARAMTSGEALAVEDERKRRLIGAASPVAQCGAGPQLVIAADQFVVKPVGRVRDTARATAVGDEVRTVIAGYHWFTDWGRDTMISLEGLTLTTGRHREAGFILRTFAHYVRDGLIPNLFPDGSDEGLYHTADATLWFFHALDRHAEVTGYWTLIEQVLPVMRDIVAKHRAGTCFGIGVDPADGLLRQGADGYQLTWMDAKVDDWVVTPRRGKAVEINALWYNALSLLSRWEDDLGDAARAKELAAEAARVRDAFNTRFWSDDLGYLYDVVDGPDGNDPACRPNQVLSISLPHAVLHESRWRAVLDVVEQGLLTPVGLRSLAPAHDDYKARYFGDLRTRDAAYHQGTVWAWWIGPWIDAWLKVHPDDRARARRFLDGLIDDLPEFGVGSIAEIFDANAPFTPRGCIAQAWSVAEALRCWVKTA